MPADTNPPAAPANPIGIIDPDGRIWPYNQVFSTQMSAAGCRPVFNKNEYVTLMKAQLVEDKKLEAERKKSMEGIDQSLFETDDLPTHSAAVDAAEAASALGLDTGKGKKSRLADKLGAE